MSSCSLVIIYGRFGGTAFYKFKVGQLSVLPWRYPQASHPRRLLTIVTTIRNTNLAVAQLPAILDLKQRTWRLWTKLLPKRADIATEPWTGRFWILILTVAKDFDILQNVPTGPGTHPAFYSKGTGFFSLEVKRPEREVTLSPLSGTKLLLHSSPSTCNSFRQAFCP